MTIDQGDSIQVASTIASVLARITAVSCTNLGFKSEYLSRVNILAQNRMNKKFTMVVQKKGKRGECRSVDDPACMQTVSYVVESWLSDVTCRNQHWEAEFHLQPEVTYPIPTSVSPNGGGAASEM